MLTGFNSQQEDARFDFENVQPLSAELEDALLASLEARLGELDAVVILDQLEIHGVITERVRERLKELAAREKGKVFWWIRAAASTCSIRLRSSRTGWSDEGRLPGERPQGDVAGEAQGDR